MKIKDNSVDLTALAPEMQPVRKHADEIFESFLGREAIITATTDGKHSPGSWHYCGYAMDFRTWVDDEGTQCDDTVRHQIATAFRIKLANYSAYYDVIEHSTHIHVEYDYFKAGKIK